ncbi:lysoplasmalogenase [Reichenbachiella agariperforans]|uniref:lysoplasmalogenase n=1 Tax=Reichenbachiella agariperforans TaxID=156994 RepID=UPI001C0942B7|nr:lysoplasmalogenase [Reichenbachiella agariperforans]MBU2913899.1 lysoplasmalogenase [Reichenbachiella agariperforans]
MKNKGQEIAKYVFVGVCIAELLTRIFDVPQLQHFTKPLLMPVLLVYFRQGTTGRLTPSFLWAAAALVFSFVGDSVLMYDQPIYFMIGLGAFAVAHVFYMVSFSGAVASGVAGPILLSKGLYAIPFLTVYGILMSALWPTLGTFKIPVAVYALILIGMALSAVYRNGRSGQQGVSQVIFGAILFLLSDSLLALNKFYMPMANAGIWVMSTYLLAQWNIINGLQKHYNA